MAFIFYLLGWLSIVVGGALAFLGLHGAGTNLGEIQRQFDFTLNGLAFMAPAALGGWVCAGSKRATTDLPMSNLMYRL